MLSISIHDCERIKVRFDRAPNPIGARWIKLGFINSDGETDYDLTIFMTDERRARALADAITRVFLPEYGDSDA